MKRVLFVDDEPKVLDGLKRMLRSMRKEWEMVFAPGGKEALAEFEAKVFDVVVTDMRMPVMDGVQLLTEVRRLYPKTVRIVLSGYSEKEMVLRAVGPTHQYLSKPCDAELLKNVITRACALRDLSNNDQLREIISQIESLPSPPLQYYELMEAIRSSDASASSVGKIIRKDVGMTAKILHLVNSAFFGITRQIYDPVEATTFLGLDTIRTLVLTISVFTQFEDTQFEDLCLNQFQSHSMTTGILARRIAELEGCDEHTRGHVLIAGTLHDVGKLVLAANLPDRYREALTMARDDQLESQNAEQEVFGTSHAEVGAYLLGLWGLPDPIVEALMFHHCPSMCRATEFTPLTAIHVANALSHEIDDGDKQLLASRLDNGYLEEINCDDRIPAWRELAAGILQEEAT